MHTAEKIVKKKDRAKLAVGLAMESRWEEAVTTNRDILMDRPDDVEAWNRLGKGLSEVGKYSEARDAFKKVLALSPSNIIAKKNLERIGRLGEDNPQAAARQGVPPHFFIEETGKTGVSSLVDMGPRQTLARMTAGETVRLEPQEHKLLVRNTLGEYVGTVDPKLGLRLLRMIRGGNRYEAAIAGLNEKGVRVIIREAYQHPSQVGRLSFPPKGHDDFRPTVWEGALKYGLDDDEDGAIADNDDSGDEAEPALDEVVEYKSLRGRPRRRSDDGDEEEM